MNRPNAYIAALRKEYISQPLTSDEVDPNPFQQFEKWFAEAEEGKVEEPNAMHLATCSKEGKPSGRIVLLKGIDEDGFVFYTNYQSRKGEDLKDNPHAALTFFWVEMSRQVRIEGEVKKVKPSDSDAYFHSRPYDSQIGALASNQSKVIPNREVLDDKFTEIKEKYNGSEVPRPKHWGGYIVIPSVIEFWQGRENRLHDRIRYDLDGKGGWNIERLSP